MRRMLSQPLRPRTLVLVGLLLLLAGWGSYRALSPPPNLAPEKIERVVGPAVHVKPEVRDVPEAWAQPSPAPLPLIPRPKEAKFSTGDWKLQGPLKLCLSRQASPLEQQAARELEQALASRGLEVQESLTAEPLHLEVGAGPGPPQVPPQAESYWLRVDEGGAALVGRDERGLYLGVQTLKQLVREGPGLAKVQVRDWPSLAFRGIHWTGGARSGPFQRDLIERILAPLKINKVLFETEYACWTSQPKLRQPQRSVSLEELKKTVEFARVRGLEPIPLIQCFSHCGWLFTDAQNKDLDLDGLAYGYNPDVPRTYEVIFAVLQEALDIFHPRLFHIGHDEARTSRRELDLGALYLKDAIKLHDWLRERGVETMMWGDQIEYRDEAPDDAFARSLAQAQALRSALPKDILIADWHYADTDDFSSVPMLQGCGFKVLGCSAVEGHYWGNIQKFARALVKSQAEGMLHTTWAGYDFNSDILQGFAFDQLVSYVVAAEHAWNGGEPLEFDPEEAFRRLWYGTRSSPARAGFTVSLRSVSNAEAMVWGTSASLFWDVPQKAAPQAPSWPHGPARLGGTQFDLDGAVLFSGAGHADGPGSLQLDLDRPCTELQLLLGTTGCLPSGMAGNLTVSYPNGQAQVVPLPYVKAIRAFCERAPCAQAETVWIGAFAGGVAVRVRRLVWTNPHPEWPVKSLTLSTTGWPQSPLLLGVTGLN